MDGHGIRFGRLAAGIGVSDMARALAFYTGVLGFEAVFQNGDPVIFTILERDAAELHLLLAPGHRGPAFNVAHLFVDDVDALHASCVAAGVTIVKTLADKDYGMRAFVIADPDGNCIDIGAP
ncbi:glyoxalase [alpha proteobacterium AAP81b]|nr:glyoxalase [alpha proteobacterium AAP81b]